jgi:hypothetical protein
MYVPLLVDEVEEVVVVDVSDVKLLLPLLVPAWRLLLSMPRTRDALFIARSWELVMRCRKSLTAPDVVDDDRGNESINENLFMSTLM